MTSTSRSIEDFIGRLKNLRKEIQDELDGLKTNLDDLEKAKTTLEKLQSDGGIIAGYNSQAIKDIEKRISYIPANIKCAEERLCELDGAIKHSVRYDQDTCQHDLKESGYNYHNNYAEYTCTKCGAHR